MVEQAEEERERKGSRPRSPNYPSMALDEAIERVRILNSKEGRSAAPVEVAFRHWGYQSSSGPAKATLAALLQFELLQGEGIGDKKKVRISDLGWRIIGDKREISPERDEAISLAALNPPIHAELFTSFPEHELGRGV